MSRMRVWTLVQRTGHRVSDDGPYLLAAKSTGFKQTVPKDHIARHVYKETELKKGYECS